MKMIKVKILGTELEADLLNPAVTKKYEENFDQAVLKIKGADACETGSAGVLAQCNAIIEYIDSVFGAGAAKKVFGNEVDLLTCFEALEEMVDLYKEQIAPVMNERVKRFNAKLEQGDKE